MAGVQADVAAEARGISVYSRRDPADAAVAAVSRRPGVQHKPRVRIRALPLGAPLALNKSHAFAFSNFLLRKMENGSHLGEFP